MDPTAAKYIGAGIACIGMGGAGVGVGIIFGNYLAAALRGAPIHVEELPNLREDHNALVHSGDALNDRYALVKVETDRITNSLNTLSGEILRWTSAGNEAVAQGNRCSRQPTG